MEFVAYGFRESSVVSLIKRFLIPLLLVTCVLYALRYLAWWLRVYLILRPVPGPDKLFPPSSYVFLKKPYLAKGKNANAEFTAFVRDVIENYPGVCKLYVGFSPMVILSTAQAASAIFSDTINLGKPFGYKYLDDFITNSILTTTGDFWRHQRRLALPAFRAKMNETFIEVLNKQSAKFVQYLAGLPADEEIRLFHETSKCTMNVIVESALGIDIEALTGENEYGDALIRLQLLVLHRMGRPWLWPDSIYYRTKWGKQMRSLINKMRGLSSKILTQAQREREAERRMESKLGDDQRALLREKRKGLIMDFALDAYLDNQADLPENWLQTTIDGAIFAGQDTTASTLTWTLYILGVHREVQERCREELKRVVGDDPSTFITVEHLKGVKYVEAAVKEAMRLYSPVPLIGRQLDTDIEVKGDLRTYTIPAGTTVGVSIFNVNRDPRSFPDPEKYDPERFLDENAPHKKDPFAYVPFSAGPRNCPGQRLGLMEAKVILIYLLRNFKWTSVEPTDKISVSWEMVLRAPGDLTVKLEPLRPIEDDPTKK